MNAADEKLLDAVVLAMRRTPPLSPDVSRYDDPPYSEEWMRSLWWELRARAAINAVHENEPRPGESFAHTACAFLADWKAGRLTAEEVCSTLWAAAEARGLNKETGS